VKRVLVFFEDEFLFKRIKAELSPEYECVKFGEVEVLPSDIVIAEKCDGLDGSIRFDLLLSYESSLPLCTGDISRLISALPKKPRLMLIEKEHACTLDGERIRLSELEYALLSLLVARGGEFFPKNELCTLLFGESGFGMLNLYIHYLRAKLEGESRRIIISQRNLGYKISEEFIKGGSVC